MRRIVAAAAAIFIWAGTETLSSAQTTETTGLTPPGARTPIPFPSTPTPKPTPVPMTQEQLETFVIPKADLDASSNTIGIWYNGQRKSELHDCGCVSKKLGGIDKEAKFVETLGKLGVPSLGVEAGGYLKDMPTENDLNRTGFLLKALKKLNYGAFNVGFTDVGLGADRLKSAADAAGAQLISANITDGEGKLLFKPYVILDGKTRNGTAVKIGVIGVTRPRIMMPKNNPMTPGVTTPTATMAAGPAGASGVTFGDQAEALKKYVPEVRKASDIVVLLDYDKRDGVTRTINELPPEAAVDIAVAGEFVQDLDKVAKVNQTNLVSGSTQGKHVGVLLADVQDKGLVGVRNRWLEVVQNVDSVPEFLEIMNAARPQPAKPAGVVSPTTGTKPKLNLGI